MTPIQKAAHTPGPWTIDREFDQVHIVAGRSAVARVMHGRADAEANTRLIAAAPDLLFELEGLVHFADGFGVHGDGPAAQELRKWISGARAAIAKATGEPS